MNNILQYFQNDNFNIQIPNSSPALLESCLAVYTLIGTNKNHYIWCKITFKKTIKFFKEHF